MRGAAHRTGSGEGSLPSTISVASERESVASMELSQRPGHGGVRATVEVSPRSRVAAWDVKGATGQSVRSGTGARKQQGSLSRQRSTDSRLSIGGQSAAGASMRGGAMSGLNGGLDYEAYDESVRSMGNGTITEDLDTGRARSPGVDAVEPPMGGGGGGNGSM